MKNRNVFIQRELSTCGACSIQSIVSYYGGYVPLNKVIEDTFTTKDGTNAYNMIKSLEKYGFSAYGMKVSYENISNDYLPAIAHIKKNGYDHFLVIYEIKKDKVITMDPEFGKKIYKESEFMNIYDDILIICKVKGKVVHYEKSHKLKEILLSELKQQKHFLIYQIILMAFVLILSLIISSYIKFIEIFNNNIYGIIFSFITVILLKNIINIIRELNEVKISNEYSKSLHDYIIKYIFKIDELYLTNKREGEIIEKISDSSYIEEYLIKIITSFPLDILLLLCSLIIILIIKIQILPLILIGFSIFTLIYTLISNKIYKNEYDNIYKYNTYKSDLTEYIGGIYSIKNLGKENVFTSKLVDDYSIYKDSTYKKCKLNSLTFNFGSMILDITYLITISYTFLNMSFYDTFLISSIYGIASSSLINILSYLPGFMHIKTIFNNISEFLDLKVPTYKNDVKYDFNTLKIDHLSYKYGNKSIIDNISYTINKKDKILVMGDSGIGKSTLAKIISGHLNNYGGGVKLDGSELKSINKISELITYVGQNETLFTDSLKNNITLGNYDEKQFNEVIDICNLKDLAKNDIDKVSLDKGINYSLGERSRIILARSLYKKPKILILDETLSNVSISMEDDIINKLKQINDLTLIYITHRNKKKLFDKMIEIRKD